MKFYLPPQIKHLLPAFLVFIFLFLLGRHLIIPDTFGDLGHYRAASLEDNADKDLQYAGHETCADCHDDIADGKAAGVHRSVTCETCHGPGLAHTDNMEASSIKVPEGRDHCGLCHGMVTGRDKATITQINLEEHNTENENCTDCHNPHQPWELNE
jgi:hypothetical protein